MITKKKSAAVKFVEKHAGGPLTFGRRISSLRKGEDLTLEAFAEVLGISKQHLNDIEKGRKAVSPERAAKFAQILGFGANQFVRLALQDQLNSAGLNYQVHLSER